MNLFQVSATIRRNRFLVDYMLDNIFYPLFLHDLHKRTKI